METKLNPHEILSPIGANGMGAIYTTLIYRNRLIWLRFLETISQRRSTSRR